MPLFMALHYSGCHYKGPPTVLASNWGGEVCQRICTLECISHSSGAEIDVDVSKKIFKCDETAPITIRLFTLPP